MMTRSERPAYQPGPHPGGRGESRLSEAARETCLAQALFPEPSPGGLVLL